MFKVNKLQSGYVSEHQNLVLQRYRSEHSMHMLQLFLALLSTQIWLPNT